jgi:hypothetical protein
MIFPVENDEEEDWDKREQTVFDIMSDWCNLTIVNSIISAKYRLNIIGVGKNTTLHLVAFKIDKRLVAVLIRDGADVKLINLKEEEKNR